MFKIVTILFYALLTVCCGVYAHKTARNNTDFGDKTRSIPSKSEVYFHQTFSRTELGNDGQPTYSEEKITTTYPTSIQAVNESLEDAALKVSETRNLLGYEPETWNNRYTPPIPLDVLASETDEDEHDSEDRSDDDDGDNDSDESNEDEQTHHNNHDDGADNNEREDDEAPERDGEITEEYNDENAQKVIDEVDGDIHGQEDNKNDDFAFAATVQHPTIAKLSEDEKEPQQEQQKQQKQPDKPQRCKTIYRELNGFTPNTKLLSDNDDFEFRWRRKRSLESDKPEPVARGQAQSSSYMITRECTFDDEEDDGNDEDAGDSSSEQNDKNQIMKNNEKVEKPGIASSKSWSLRSSIPTPTSTPSSPLLSSPSVSSKSGSSSSRKPTGSRSESRFIPIFGWKKQQFLSHEEKVPTYFGSMSIDSDGYQPMNDDFGNHEPNDFWIQPNAQPWNEWNHFHGSGKSNMKHPGGNHYNEQAHHHDDEAIWIDDSAVDQFNQNADLQSQLSPPYESFFEWTQKPALPVKNKKFSHSDDVDDEGEGHQEDENTDDSGDDEASSSIEEDSGLEQDSPIDSGIGNVRRMFTQHIRHRRSIENYSGSLNKADFSWTQPAKNAQQQMQHDTPYTWNYFEQHHPHKNDHSHDDEGSNNQEAEEHNQFNSGQENLERKPMHEENSDESSEDDDGVNEENQENDDESIGTNGGESGNDPDNYSNSYNGGNHEEAVVDYDSDRLSDNGAHVDGGKQLDENTSSDDEDGYEKF